MIDFAAKNREFRATRTQSFGLGVLAKEAEQDYPHLSASQLKTWHRCKRLWYLEKVCKLKREEKAHFNIGHVIHRISERYQLKLSKDWEGIFDKGWDESLTPQMSTWIRTMAVAAVEKGLWQASDDVLVEHPMAMLIGKEWLDDRGLPWLVHADTFTNDHGTKGIKRPTKLVDGRLLPQGWDRLPVFVGFADQCFPTRSPPKVGDHKSAKHRGYATTPGKLASDVQMLTYSAWMLAYRRDVTQVDLQHNVFLKDKQTAEGAYPVRAVAELARVQEEWARVVEAAEGMKLVREQVPVVVDPARPYARANQWQRVSSAIEEGCAKESCNAYGGCPFKDVCHGRATAEQALAFIERPTIATASAAKPPPTPKPTPSFGLNLKAFEYAQPKEASMPFIPPKPAPAQFTDVFLLEPDNPAVQYRARQFPAERAEPGLMVMKLWPHVDIEPKWGDLPPMYRLEWSPDQVSQLPYPTAKLTGYHEALLGAGQSVDDCAWTDSTGVQHLQPNNAPRSPILPASATPPALTVSTGIVPTSKPPNRPAADGAFGLLKMPGATVTPPAEVIPAPTFEAKPGQIVEVLPSSNPFFHNLAGKHGKVIEVGPGDGGLLFVDVMLADGTALSDVASGRFKLSAQQPAAPAPASAPTPEQQAMMQFVAQVSLLIGKQVQVERHSGGQPVRCVLEKVTEEGLEALGGKLKVAWADVKGIGEVPADALPPGAPAPKPTKEEKEAAKAAAKAQKDAEKAAAKAAKDAEKEAAKTAPPLVGLGGPVAGIVVANSAPAAPVLSVTPQSAHVPGMFTVAEIAAKSAEVQTHLSNAVMAQNQLRNMLNSYQQDSYQQQPRQGSV